MKPMNFIEWLALKEFEMGSNGEPEFSNGQTKPTPQLTSLANNITANSQPNTINKINTAPESKKKQTLMNTVKKKIRCNVKKVREKIASCVTITKRFALAYEELSMS